MLNKDIEAFPLVLLINTKTKHLFPFWSIFLLLHLTSCQDLIFVFFFWSFPNQLCTLHISHFIHSGVIFPFIFKCPQHVRKLNQTFINWLTTLTHLLWLASGRRRWPSDWCSTMCTRQVILYWGVRVKTKEEVFDKGLLYWKALVLNFS